MIDFFSETDFELEHKDEIAKWISSIILVEECSEGDINFIFCDDNYLHKLNVQFLDHDTLTDIISFDNSLGTQIHGEIYISVERVKENAHEFQQSFQDELHRVIIHGILHFCGYKDKSESEEKIMRSKEEHALKARQFV